MKFLLSFLLTASVLSAEQVQKIVVYRSQLEMEREQWIMDHPETGMQIFWVIVVSTVLLIGYKIWSDRKKNRRW